MRKKWWIAGAAFGLGAVMFMVSGFSAMAGTSGYDAYKEAVKQTKAEKSLTANANLSITDNGTQLLAGTAVVKLNRQLQAGSMAATFSGPDGEHTLNVYRQDGKVIFKSGDHDIYRVMDSHASKWQHDGTAPPKAAEQVFDALMGNIRELATVESEADGSRSASLHLSGSQIPAIVNALGTLAVSKAADGGKWHHGGVTDAHFILPKLTNDLKVESVNLDARISPDHRLERQTAEIRITGKEDNGKPHDLAIRLQVGFAGYNQTIPDRIDLTGEQTEEIQSGAPGRGWHRG